MNQKELGEIRRRFRADRSNITHIYGCYVGSNKEIISRIDMPVSMMGEEETGMYMSVLKKTLSGTLGRNLLDIEFATQQVANGEEHRLLTRLRESELRDSDAREALYQRIISGLTMEDNYVILLAGERYDVPFRGKDDMGMADASEQVYAYLVCCVCPVKPASLALRYSLDESVFRSTSTGQILSAPEVGFLWPTFDARMANIYNALYYAHKPDQIHPEFIESVFCTQPMLSADQQKGAFHTALCQSLEKDCSFDMVQQVHEQIRTRIDEHKELKDPEVLALTVAEVGDMLQGSGASDQQVEQFKNECRREFGDDASLTPINIIDSRKFEVTTPEIKISVDPAHSYLIESRVIGGRKFLLIPADTGVEINGISVTVGQTGTEE